MSTPERMSDEDFASLQREEFTSWPINFRAAMAEADRARQSETKLEIDVVYWKEAAAIADGESRADRERTREIEAHLETLREALEQVITDIDNPSPRYFRPGGWEGAMMLTAEMVRRALKTTPESSYSELRNEVLEEAAQKADSCDCLEPCGCSVSADRIRALKETTP